jgi:hypothetical protein
VEEPQRRHQKRIARARELNPAGEYTAWLDAMHRILQPATYVEVGVATGATLAFAESSTRVFGIDPEPNLRFSLPGLVTVFAESSDDFFAQHARQQIESGSVDLAFIDGLHVFRQAARDLRNVASYMNAQGLIVVHDVVPPDAKCADARRRTHLWPGDVYKLLPFILLAYPEADPFMVRTYPTGLLIVRNPAAIKEAQVSGDELERALDNADNVSVEQFYSDWLSLVPAYADPAPDPDLLLASWRR